MLILRSLEIKLNAYLGCTILLQVFALEIAFQCDANRLKSTDNFTTLCTYNPLSNSCTKLPYFLINRHRLEPKFESLASDTGHNRCTWPSLVKNMEANLKMSQWTLELWLLYPRNWLDGVDIKTRIWTQYAPCPSNPKNHRLPSQSQRGFQRPFCLFGDFPPDSIC